MDVYTCTRVVHPAGMCLLVGVFNPFTFKVIMDIYNPITVYVIIWGLFSVGFIFPSHVFPA